MPDIMVHGSKMRVNCNNCNARGRVGGETLYNSQICCKCNGVGTLVVPDPDVGNLIKVCPKNVPLSEIPEFAEFTYFIPPLHPHRGSMPKGWKQET